MLGKEMTTPRTAFSDEFSTFGRSVVTMIQTFAMDGVSGFMRKAIDNLDPYRVHE